MVCSFWYFFLLLVRANTVQNNLGSHCLNHVISVSLKLPPNWWWFFFRLNILKYPNILSPHSRADHIWIWKLSFMWSSWLSKHVYEIKSYHLISTPFMLDKRLCMKNVFRHSNSSIKGSLTRMSQILINQLKTCWMHSFLLPLVTSFLFKS